MMAKSDEPGASFKGTDYYQKKLFENEKVRQAGCVCSDQQTADPLARSRRCKTLLLDPLVHVIINSLKIVYFCS